VLIRSIAILQILIIIELEINWIFIGKVSSVNVGTRKKIE